MSHGRGGIWRRHGGRTTASGRSCRPRVESLEQRLVPATFPFDTFENTPSSDSAGQDAYGQVSLQFATDSIVNVEIDASTTSNEGDVAGDLDDRGDPTIEGHDENILDARHLDRLFEMHEGHLQLDAFTLTGVPGHEAVAPELGSVERARGQIAEDAADFEGIALAMVEAMLARQQGKAAADAAAISQTSVTPPAIDFRLIAPVTNAYLDGGGGSEDAEQGQEAHEVLWSEAEEAKVEPLAENPEGEQEQSDQLGPPDEPETPEIMVSFEENASGDEVVAVVAGECPREAAPLPSWKIEELWLTRLVARGNEDNAMMILVVLARVFHVRIRKDNAAVGRRRRRHTCRQSWLRRSGRRHKRRRTRGPPDRPAAPSR